MFIFKKSLENKMNSHYNIYINPNFGRFGNQLFPIFVAVSMYEEGNFNKIYFNDKRRKLNSDFINSKILDIVYIFINSIKNLLFLNINNR